MQYKTLHIPLKKKLSKELEAALHCLLQSVLKITTN